MAIKNYKKNNEIYEGGGGVLSVSEPGKKEKPRKRGNGQKELKLTWQKKIFAYFK